MAMKKESGGKKPMAKMAVKGQASRSKTNDSNSAARVQKAIKAVQKRTGVTAREARDIVTEVGTIAKFNYAASAQGATKFQNYKNPAAKSGAKSLMKQVKEVGTAAKTGKPGTTPAQIMRKDGKILFGESAGGKQRTEPKRMVKKGR
jgi:hypothetical protein